MDLSKLIQCAPNGATHIIKSKNTIKYIKVNSQKVEYWRITPKMYRQDFSVWSYSDLNIGGWIWLGLITFERYLVNHNAEILHTF